MNKPSSPQPVAAVNPFELARILASDLLHAWPQALNRVTGLLRARDIPNICALGQISDSEYQESDINRDLALRQISCLFKKNAAFSDDNSCSLAARKGFELGEERCRATNRRLDEFYVDGSIIAPILAEQIEKMQHMIAVLLGSVNDLVDNLPSIMSLTSGATEDRSRLRALPFLKISGRFRLPRLGFPYLMKVLRLIGVEPASCKFANITSNTVVLVPKNWKTHRTIAKEPTHALPFQLATDKWIKRKLRRWGVDLSSQSRNQVLAQQGSIDGSFSTLDLEMASDTLSFNTVALLLPYEWLAFLEAFRSTSFNAPWGSGEYAKFSSMGNGYTFTLETLIFTAACRAVGSTDYAVYGDDIVIETVHVPALVELLSFLGFTVNREKSFVDPSSRFRESCGGDFFAGRRVTPTYLREVPLKGDLSGISHLVNGIAAVGGLSTWKFLSKIVVDNRLRLVPWNQDTRSGVHIPINTAWKAKKVRIDTRKAVKGLDNPMLGFPVYDGYGVKQSVRRTQGWRSLLLWFIRAGLDEDAIIRDPSSTSMLFLKLNETMVTGDDVAVTTAAKVVVRSCYVHKTRRFLTVDSHTTPMHLYPFGDMMLAGGTAP